MLLLGMTWAAEKEETEGESDNVLLIREMGVGLKGPIGTEEGGAVCSLSKIMRLRSAFLHWDPPSPALT
jgi:hypothetical protein